MNTPRLMTISGRQCKLIQGEGSTVVICCMHTAEINDLYSMATSMTDIPFSLFCFEVDSWNDELSPWKSDALDGFAGKGEQTLSWITDQAIPYLKQTYGAEKFLLAGYSLAGLFSLWASKVSDQFCGSASCSGSLWFPGWTSFSEANSIRRAGSFVYLSLGGKESKSPDELVSTIEDKTRKEIAILEKDPNVCQSKLEFNAGGHFTKTTWRLAKGIAWLVERA